VAASSLVKILWLLGELKEELSLEQARWEVVLVVLATEWLRQAGLCSVNLLKMLLLFLRLVKLAVANQWEAHKINQREVSLLARLVSLEELAQEQRIHLAALVVLARLQMILMQILT
jgi:hypothetical protein